MRKSLTIFFWTIEVWAVQKHVHLVDLVKSFPTSINLLTSASMQPRTSPQSLEGFPEFGNFGRGEKIQAKFQTPGIWNERPWNPAAPRSCAWLYFSTQFDLSRESQMLDRISQRTVEVLTIPAPKTLSEFNRNTSCKSSSRLDEISKVGHQATARGQTTSRTVYQSAAYS